MALSVGSFEVSVTSVVTLNEMLVRRKVTPCDLAAHVGTTETSLSLLRSSKVKGVRFETLAAICGHLQCQPGDLPAWVAPVDRVGDAGA